MKKFALLPLAVLAFAAACGDTSQNPLEAPGTPLLHGGQSWKLTKPTIRTYAVASTPSERTVTIYWDASLPEDASHDDLGAYRFILRKQEVGGWTTIVNDPAHSKVTAYRSVVLNDDGVYLVSVRAVAEDSPSHNSRRSSACFSLGTAPGSCAGVGDGDTGDPGDGDIEGPITPTDPTGPLAQTITFNPLTDKVYGDEPFDVSATASSGLGVMFFSLTEPTCSVTATAGRITILAAGTCTIRATQSGGFNDGNIFEAATPAEQSFEIARKALTITASSPANIILGSPVPAITPSYAGFVLDDNAENSLTTAPACSTAYTVNSPVGTYTTTCEGAEADNYAISYTEGSFKVVFGWNGFLQPINDTAHQVGVNQSRFKLGSTVPARFAITDAAGNVVQQAGNPTFTRSGRLRACDASTTPENPVAVSPSNGTSYSWNGSHYHFNWSTKSLQAGVYRIDANLGDGERHSVEICLW